MSLDLVMEIAGYVSAAVLFGIAVYDLVVDFRS